MRRWTPGTTMSPSSDMRWPYTRRSSATREYSTPTPKGPWRGSPTKEIQLSPSLRGCPSLAWWPWDFPSTSSEDKKQKKKTGQLSPYRRNRASPRSWRRRASSVPTAPTEPLQEVEGDGPAPSLQPQPSLSKKWKETGQLSPYRPNRASPRSGRRRASSVLTAPAEPLQEVEVYVAYGWTRRAIIHPEPRWSFASNSCDKRHQIALTLIYLGVYQSLC